MTTLTVAPSEPMTPVCQRSPSPMRRNQNITNSQNRQGRQRQRPPILKSLHFKDSDNTQVIQDLVLCPILGIIFLTQDSDPFQDLIPDLNLEISTNQLNVIIVTAWVTLQTIVSDIRTGIFHADSQTKVGKIISEILNNIQTTEQIPDTEMIMLLSAELISQNHQCIQIYRQGISDKH